MNLPFYGAASITTSKRSELMNIENSQGPGMYDVTKDKYGSSSPKWSMKKRNDYGSCFKVMKENRPPPGSYEVSGNIKHKVTLKNPNFRSEKYSQINEKIAHYSDLNLSSSLNTKSGISFGYRDQLALFKNQSCSPGPIYNPIKPTENSRELKNLNTCIGFGYGERNAIYKSNNDSAAGPGAYYHEESRVHNGSHHSPEHAGFGKSPRNVQHKSNPLGPGEYSPKILNNGSFLLNTSKGFKLKGKLAEASKYVNPNGPGSYDLPDTKNTIGPRFNHFRHKSSTSQNELPSPFTYECARYPQFLDDKKGFSLGKKINTLVTMTAGSNPGPGTYQMSQNISAPRSGGYMGHKIVRKKKVIQQDCFGKYEPKIIASARSGGKYSFGTDAKSWNKVTKDETIGPAYYEFREKRMVESYSMGTSQRFKQLRKQREYVSLEKAVINSTIGYLPSYLKKGKMQRQKRSTVLNE